MILTPCKLSFAAANRCDSAINVALYRCAAMRCTLQECKFHVTIKKYCMESAYSNLGLIPSANPVAQTCRMAVGICCAFTVDNHMCSPMPGCFMHMMRSG